MTAPSADRSNASVSVLLNNGSAGGPASFAPQAVYSVGTQPEGLAIADIDGKNGPDILVVNEISVTLGVLLNQGLPRPSPLTPGGLNDGPLTGNGVFGAMLSYASSTAPDDVAVADIDGDGHLDAVTTGGEVHIRFGNVTGLSSRVTVYTLAQVAGHRFSGVAVGDFNADSLPDIAVGTMTRIAPGCNRPTAVNYNGHNLTVLLSNASAPGSLVASGEYIVDASPWQVEVGDFNGDSKVRRTCPPRSCGRLTPFDCSVGSCHRLRGRRLGIASARRGVPRLLMLPTCRSTSY